jgi:surface antigen
MGQAKGYYDTGKIPVEGSIAVFDQSAEVFHHDNRVFTADKVNGHVGIVEEIKIVEGGYEIRMSHAGVVYENGNPVSGTYAKYQDLIFEVPFEGLEDIGFIYD